MQVAVWREQDAMRQCRNGFGVIPRSFRDEKEIDFAALQPRALTATFATGPELFRAKACPALG
jgi:hypothetical protein